MASVEVTSSNEAMGIPDESSALNNTCSKDDEGRQITSVEINEQKMTEDTEITSSHSEVTITSCESTQEDSEKLHLNAASMYDNDVESSGITDVEQVSQVSSTTFDDTCKLAESVPNSENLLSSMDIIMSTTAQHIRQTITEVLKSREALLSLSSTPDDFPSRLAGNLKEKIADFEKTVQQSNTDSTVSDGFTSSLETLPANCDESVNEADHNVDNSSDSTMLNMNINTSDSNNTNDKTKNDKDSTVNIVANTEPNTNLKSEQSNSEKLEEEESNECISSHTEKANLVMTEISEGEKSPKKSQKSNLSSKKKGEKTVDQVMKSLSSYGTVEERLLALCRKQVEVLEEQRTMEGRLKQSERYTIQLTREKEQLQAEHNRTVLAKSRLESLCRELQRQNKAIKEESLLRIREEEEKRKEVASKFQATLNDISNLMQENSQRNSQLKEENAELAKKLKSLVEHYEMWEKHMEKVVQQKDLEAQLAKAKLAKANLQQKQETETFLREKQQLLEKMNELQKRCSELSANELQMRNEFSLYTSKYEEFQSVLNKSNQVFASFKTDMETTSKKIKKLEKETGQWKQRWENSNRALLEMVADKQKRDQELLNSKQRILMLEKLCRALQAERNDLHNQLKKQEHVLQTGNEELEQNAELPEQEDTSLISCEQVD